MSCSFDAQQRHSLDCTLTSDLLSFSTSDDLRFEFPSASVPVEALRPREAPKNTTSSEGQDVVHQPGPAERQSSYRDMSWDTRSGKWKAQLKCDGKQKSLGHLRGRGGGGARLQRRCALAL